MTGKKILFVLPRMGGGGAERVTALVSNTLVSKGNDVTIYTLVGGESFYHLDDKVKYKYMGITVDRSSKLKLLWSEAKSFGGAFLSIRKLIKKEKFDVVVSLLVETDILVALCKLSGLRFNHVCSERNDPTKRSGTQLRIINEIYKRAKLFICQSKMVADYYTSVPDAIKRIIPNPVESKNLPERRPPVPNRIVAVGRLSLQKNFSMLINSFNNVYKEFPGCKLDIYGEGEIRGQLEKQIDDLGLNDVVTLCGAKTNVQECIADADLFVMSSDYEGFPNALLEAVAIGLPVISTAFPTGVAYELITDDNGIIVPVNDEGAMTDAIRNMLSDKDRLEVMGKNSHESAKKYYTENIIKMWEDALTEIL